MFSTSTKEAANVTKDLAENDLKNNAQQAKNQARGTFDRVTDEASDYANQAGRKVRGIFDSANDEFGAVSEKVTGEIRSNPVRSSVIALVVGLVLGSIFSR